MIVCMGIVPTVCVAQDSENRDVIVCVGIVPTESAESYTFMIDRMKGDPKMKAFLEQENLLVELLLSLLLLLSL